MQRTPDPKKNAHREATSRAMQKTAERLRCPECGRANALKQHRFPQEMLVIWKCRYCDLEESKSY